MCSKSGLSLHVQLPTQWVSSSRQKLAGTALIKTHYLGIFGCISTVPEGLRLIQPIICPYYIELSVQLIGNLQWIMETFQVDGGLSQHFAAADTVIS